MGPMELRWLLGWYVCIPHFEGWATSLANCATADSFNINTWMISSSQIVDGLSWWQSWICVWVCPKMPFMLRIFLISIAWLQHSGRFRVRDRPYWSNISHLLPRCRSIFFRYLGCAMASIQQGCYGLYLVRRTGLDWRHLCVPDDPQHLERLARCKY